MAGTSLSTTGITSPDSPVNGAHIGDDGTVVLVLSEDDRAPSTGCRRSVTEKGISQYVGS